MLISIHFNIISAGGALMDNIERLKAIERSPYKF
jgi:hypothetical protein